MPLISTEIRLAEPTRMPVVRVSGFATFFVELGDVARSIGSPRVLLVPIQLPMIAFPLRFWPGR